MGGGIGHLVLSGPLILAVPVAAAAGAVTFLSPCVLPLVPGYLSYVAGMSGVDAQASLAADGARRDGQHGRAMAIATPPRLAVRPRRQRQRRRRTAVKVTAATTAASPGRPRTVVGTALFVLGFSVVFATEGVAFGGLGSVLRAHTAVVTQILGGVTIILGLLFAGVFDRFPVTGRIIRPSVRPRAGLAGAPLLGALFGVSWTPCIGPTLRS